MVSDTLTKRCQTPQVTSGQGQAEKRPQFHEINAILGWLIRALETCTLHIPELSQIHAASFSLFPEEWGDVYPGELSIYQFPPFSTVVCALPGSGQSLVPLKLQRPPHHLSPDKIPREPSPGFPHAHSVKEQS